MINKLYLFNQRPLYPGNKPWLENPDSRTAIDWTPLGSMILQIGDTQLSIIDGSLRLFKPQCAIKEPKPARLSPPCPHKASKIR